MSKLSSLDGYDALLKAAKMPFNLADAFIKNPHRVDELTLSIDGVLIDFSKNLIDPHILNHLLNLVKQRRLQDKKQALFNGEKLNFSEQRQVLHPLLRATKAPPQLQQEFAAVKGTQLRVRKLTQAIHSGKKQSLTQQAFTDLIHIGIGGSYLGPEMLYQALLPTTKAHLRCHFVANICANDVQSIIQNLNPQTTLVVIASKTFTTLETMQNATTVKNWLIQSLGEEAISNHCFAVTAAPEKAIEQGFNEAHIFAFWDWVGGRFSVFSAIGLSLSLSFGYDKFEALLLGAEQMDQHFLNAPDEKNMPTLMALIGFWYTEFFNKQALCIAPYDHRLRRLPAFLQQLEMESNGKSVDLANLPIDYHTCPVIFGEPGTNCQHSFFQLLHQSPSFIPVDFMLTLDDPTQNKDHHTWLFANGLAQSKALMDGQVSSLGYDAMQGNRPSTTILFESLSAENLGKLIALYEHKVFVQSVLWDINAFDQWGVELGKKISKAIHQNLSEQIDNPLDPSTQALIATYIKKATLK